MPTEMHINCGWPEAINYCLVQGPVLYLFVCSFQHSFTEYKCVALWIFLSPAGILVLLPVKVENLEMDPNIHKNLLYDKNGIKISGKYKADH
jgi:hypothetical protein